LRAGVAAVNITVEKPDAIMHDPLFAKALVLVGTSHNHHPRRSLKSQNGYSGLLLIFA